jgi:hypothetical protein
MAIVLKFVYERGTPLTFDIYNLQLIIEIREMGDIRQLDT